jgi:serine/threonine protein kinase
MWMDLTWPSQSGAPLMIGQTLGHYRILQKVAAGGMGVVYRARDEQLERDVALKVLPSGALSDDTARRHFRKEAMALAKLNHPNIETIYEFGSQDGTDFLVMEYVPGKTLADRLAGGRLPEKEIIALGMQIAAALEEAHERGIVHRDLKPANIAISAMGQAKILDFGLAKLLRPVDDGTTDVLTDSQAAAGTLPYMPPEQLRGESVDARADVYTIGAVLYEMATGHRAFQEVLASRLIAARLQGTRNHHPEVFGQRPRSALPICQRTSRRLAEIGKQHESCGSSHHSGPARSVAYYPFGSGDRSRCHRRVGPVVAPRDKSATGRH